MTALIVAVAVLTALTVVLAAALALLVREFLRREREWALERDDLTRRLAPGYRWWTQPGAEPAERVIDPTEDDQMAAEWGPVNG